MKHATCIDNPQITATGAFISDRCAGRSTHCENCHQSNGRRLHPNSPAPSLFLRRRAKAMSDALNIDARNAAIHQYLRTDELRTHAARSGTSLQFPECQFNRSGSETLIVAAIARNEAISNTSHRIAFLTATLHRLCRDSPSLHLSSGQLPRLACVLVTRQIHSDQIAVSPSNNVLPNLQPRLIRQHLTQLSKFADTQLALLSSPLPQPHFHQVNVSVVARPRGEPRIEKSISNDVFLLWHPVRIQTIIAAILHAYSSNRDIVPTIQRAESMKKLNQLILIHDCDLVVRTQAQVFPIA